MKGFQIQKIQTSNIKREVQKSKNERRKSIAKYHPRVDEIVNDIKGLGGEIKDKEVVEKVLRTLPTRYNP